MSIRGSGRQFVKTGSFCRFASLRTPLWVQEPGIRCWLRVVRHDIIRKALRDEALVFFPCHLRRKSEPAE